MAEVSTQVLAKRYTNQDEFQRRLSDTVNNILAGKSNNWGDITLTANSATTTLADFRIGINSVILLQPKTANAAGALSTTYFDTPGDGSVTINHANNAQNDRTFRYVLVG